MTKGVRQALGDERYIRLLEDKLYAICKVLMDDGRGPAVGLAVDCWASPGLLSDAAERSQSPESVTDR